LSIWVSNMIPNFIDEPLSLFFVRPGSAADRREVYVQFFGSGANPRPIASATMLGRIGHATE
jgi:hypothetical protein